MSEGLESNQKICNMQFYLAISWHNKFWVEIASCIKSSANIADDCLLIVQTFSLHRQFQDTLLQQFCVEMTFIKSS